MSVGPIIPHVFTARQAQSPAVQRSTPHVVQSAGEEAVMPVRWVSEFDRSASRIVQMLVEPSSHAVLKQFPENGQVAFSRGIAAYLEALQTAEAADNPASAGQAEPLRLLHI